MACDEQEQHEQWIFAEGALALARETARERAAQALRTTTVEGERTPGRIREPLRPLSVEEGSRLVLFYAQRLPQLCSCCGAPSEVLWTGVVFYRRFFAVRSPMEFDPLPMMFACVHVACKTEEVHEITLDKLLEEADVGADDAEKKESMKTKVSSLELPLLEGIGFDLLVEPQPDSALRMLVEELQQCIAQGPPRCHALLPTLTEAMWDEVVLKAEALVVDLGIRSDAILRWPVSIIISAALGTVLDERLGQPASDCTDAYKFSDVLGSLLDASLEMESQRAAVKEMVEDVRRSIQRLAAEGEMTEDTVKEIAKAARRCHRAFDRMREEATEQHEQHRKERKRRWTEMKQMKQAAIRRQVPTPIMGALAALNAGTAANRGTALPQLDNSSDDWLHRLEDMED